MSDDPENLTLIFLRRLDQRMERMEIQLGDIARRVTSLEAKVVLLHGDFAAQSERLDRIEVRLDRIERRMDIVTA